jgi:hypothetical protein
MDIPSCVLLDTNIVNFVLDWDEVIHDGGEVPVHVSDRDAGEDRYAKRGDAPNCGDWLAVAVF